MAKKKKTDIHTIKIGHEVYLCFLKDIVLHGNTSVLGTEDGTEMVIEIKSSLTGAQFVDTLIHEILHGCADELAADLESSDEEGVVTFVASALTTVLLDNPEVLQRIVEEMADAKRK